MTDTIIFSAIASLIALGVIFTIHAIYRPRSLSIAILMIFISISTPIALYKPFVNSLGFSVFSHNEGKEEMLSYIVGPQQEWIYLWVMDTDAVEPRSYKIPYSKEQEKALNEAKKQAEAGVRQGVEIPPKPGQADTQYEIEVSDYYDVSPGGLKG